MICFAKSLLASMFKFEQLPAAPVGAWPPLSGPDPIQSQADILGDGHTRFRFWLITLHAICFFCHSAGVAFTIYQSWGHDMTITLYRTQALWLNQKEYSYTIVEADDVHLRMDVLCASFFGLSALSHLCWLVFGGCNWAWITNKLWRDLENGVCWWCVLTLAMPHRPSAHPGRPRCAGAGSNTRGPLRQKLQDRECTTQAQSLVVALC